MLLQLPEAPDFSKLCFCCQVVGGFSFGWKSTSGMRDEWNFEFGINLP